MEKPKILLVSHDKIRRPAFAATFKNLGCQVLSTVLAQDALAALDGFKPDIVLADMSFEDMKPNEFLKKLDAHPNRKEIFFVPYTKFIEYKLTNPAMLLDSLSFDNLDKETTEKALETLGEYMRVVPGEIVMWVAEALAKKGVKVPAPLGAACQALGKISKSV